MRSVVLLLLLGACAHPTRIARAPAGPHLTVQTYNLNLGLAGEPDTLAAIGAGDPDVVLLQETSEQWEPHIRREHGRRYPHMLFHPCCGAGGLAILSKLPVALRAIIDSPVHWFPAMHAIAQTPIGPMQLLVVHLHPPVSETGSFLSGYFTTSGVRRRELDAFVAELDPDVPTLIAGDFNEPDGEAVGLLRDKGFSSALPEFDPGAVTWRWKLPIGNLRSRLDHVFYGRGLVPINARVQGLGRSDHLPVLGAFERPDGQSPPTAPAFKP